MLFRSLKGLLLREWMVAVSPLSVDSPIDGDPFVSPGVMGVGLLTGVEQSDVGRLREGHFDDIAG